MIDSRSAFPIGLIALQMEQVYVDQGMRQLRSLGATILGVRVDGIFFSGDAAGLSGTRFKITREPASKVPCNEQRRRTQNRDPPAIREWMAVNECGLDALADKVIANGGGLITGPAGTGKTEFLKRMISRWKSREQIQLILGAPTHMAARQMGGYTLEHLRRRYRHRCPEGCVFIVDEISQVSLSILSLFGRYCHLGARFVLVGDFEGQFQPVADGWPTPRAVEETSLIKRMANGLHVRLTENRRADGDDRHFKFFCGLYPDADASRLVARRRIMEATSAYPWRGEEPSVVLVLSHRKRLLVNAYYNELRDGDGVKIPCVGDLERTASQPQDMFLRKGMRLLGSGTCKKILNGTDYIVKDVDEHRVVVELAPEYTQNTHDTQNEVVLNHGDASRYLRLRYAVCYFTIQGRTLRDQHILLLDKASRHFTVRHLIVGLSRVTAGRFAHIPTRKQEADVVERWISTSSGSR